MTRKFNRNTQAVRIVSLSLIFIALVALSVFERVLGEGQSVRNAPMLVGAEGGSQQPLLAPAPAVKFAKAVPYQIHGFNPIMVAVGDLNGDGKIDAVSANFEGRSSVNVFLGNGDGTFQGAVGYGSDWVPEGGLVLSDLNADGKLDIVVLDGDAANVLLGNGDGTFQAAVVSPIVGLTPIWAVVADVNGDHKPDLLVSGYSTSGVSLLLGNGDGTFQSAVAITATSGPIAVADLNGDRQPDLVIGGGNLSVLLGNGDGTFQSAVTYGASGFSVGVADMNGDGKPDLWVGEDPFGVLLGNGDGTFQAEKTYSFGVDVRNVFVADVNADGALDAIGSDFRHSSVRVIMGNGDGTFQPAEHFGSGGRMPQGIASADFNGDQKPDLFVTNYSNDVSVLLNVEVGTKTAMTTSGTPSHGGQSVTLTAMVTPKYGGVPDGEVMKFYDGKTLLGSVPLAAGSAAYTTSSLSVKTHAIKGIYGGDGDFGSSTGKVTQVVEP